MRLLNFSKKIKTKLILVNLFIVILILLGLNAFLLPVLRNNLYQEKRTQVQEMVNAAMGILEYYQEQESTGELSREQAQNNAKEAIARLTFGYEDQDYFWINDFHPTMIMHPFVPELEGESLIDYSDPEGLYLFVEMVDIVEDQGSGFVEYQWQYYDDEDRIEPKISYVAGFEQWEWIIGTGIYVNDVREEIWSLALRVIFGSIIAIILAVILISYFSNSLSQPIKKLVSGMEKLADGDLKYRVKVDRNDELGELAKAFNQASSQQQELVKNLLDSIENLSAYSQELSASAEEGNATIQTANNLFEDISESIQDISASSQEVSALAEEANSQVEFGSENITDTLNSMKEINQVIGETVTVINELEENSTEINKIVELINNIAEQTNLLALNAAIEAARAGEHGQGFAVVAEEIRELAEETGKATEDIVRLVKKTQQNSKKGLTTVEKVEAKAKTGEKIADETGDIFEEIEDSIRKTSEYTQSTASSAQNLAGNTDTIKESFDDVENMSEEISNSSQSLAEMAQELQELISQFKI